METGPDLLLGGDKPQFDGARTPIQLKKIKPYNLGPTSYNQINTTKKTNTWMRTKKHNKNLKEHNSIKSDFADECLALS